MPNDQHVIAELSITCEDGKNRTLYVKFKSSEELYRHSDDGFDTLQERMGEALSKKYPNEDCQLDDTPEIVRTFTISEDGKTMKSTYVVDGTNELFVEVNMEVE